MIWRHAGDGVHGSEGRRGRCGEESAEGSSPRVEKHDQRENGRYDSYLTLQRSLNGFWQVFESHVGGWIFSVSKEHEDADEKHESAS